MEIVYLIHSNMYGWCLRLGGWTGPSLGNYATKEKALDVALNGAQGVDWAIAPAPREAIMVCK